MNKLDNSIARFGQVSGEEIVSDRIVFHVPDVDGKKCWIDICDFLKALRSIAPEMMDKLWEENKMKDVRIKEGKRKKGGLNEMPTTPRPNPPKPMSCKERTNDKKRKK